MKLVAKLYQVGETKSPEPVEVRDLADKVQSHAITGS